MSWVEMDEELAPAGTKANLEKFVRRCRSLESELELAGAEMAEDRRRIDELEREVREYQRDAKLFARDASRRLGKMTRERDALRVELENLEYHFAEVTEAYELEADDPGLPKMSLEGVEW